MSVNAVNPINKINTQLNSLDQVRKDKLWEEKVSNLGWAFTIIPLIQYAYALWSETASIRNYNNTLEVLINEVATRKITADEAALAGHGKIKGAYLSDVADLVSTGIAEQKFYAAFKQRCTDLSIAEGSDKFSTYLDAAMKGLENAAVDKTKRVAVGAVEYLTPLKMKTTILNLSKGRFEETLNAFVSQKAEDISFEGYAQTITRLMSCFPNNKRVTVEADVRSKFNDVTRKQFATLSTEHLNANDSTNERLKKIKEDLETTLKARQKDLHEEASALRGNNNDGTIHAASLVVTPLKAELEAARLAFNTKRKAENVGAKGSDDALRAVGEDQTRWSTELKDLKTKFDEAFDKHKEAAENLKGLQDRLNHIVRFGNDGVTYIGGELFDVNVDVENIDRIAKAKTIKMGKFYAELSIDIEGKNLQRLCDAMQVVLNS